MSNMDAHVFKNYLDLSSKFQCQRSQIFARFTKIQVQNTTNKVMYKRRTIYIFRLLLEILTFVRLTMQMKFVRDEKVDVCLETFLTRECDLGTSIDFFPTVAYVSDIPLNVELRIKNLYKVLPKISADSRDAHSIHCGK